MRMKMILPIYSTFLPEDGKALCQCYRQVKKPPRGEARSARPRRRHRLLRPPQHRGPSAAQHRALPGHGTHTRTHGNNGFLPETHTHNKKRKKAPVLLRNPPKNRAPGRQAGARRPPDGPGGDGQCRMK